jgi:ESS family glutamate:Na+ symporter
MAAGAEEIGLSLVVLSLMFACAALIRRWSSPLRKLFISTAVIGGFLVLGLGPEGIGRVLGGTGIFPERVFAVWRQLPALLVSAMSASLLLGEHLPPLGQIWRTSGSHAIMIGVMSMGQFALGGLLVWLLLEPVFGIDRKAGALIEMSFRAYSYRQIITRPILGGRFMTALAVPLIDLVGLPVFTMAAGAITAALIGWGMKRAGRSSR